MYQKLINFNTNIRKLSDKLKDNYGINVGTDLLQCVELPDAIVQCKNYNRKPIKNYTSVYQIQLYTISSALIVGRRPFESTKVSISNDPNEYLLCKQCGVNLSEKNIDKANGLQFIRPDLFWCIPCCKDIRNHYSSEFVWDFFSGMV